MDAKKVRLPSLHIMFITIMAVLGFLEGRPIDMMIAGMLFMAALLISYIPFIGFYLYLQASSKITELLTWSFVATAYWVTTIWALIVCIASSTFVILRVVSIIASFFRFGNIA